MPDSFPFVPAAAIEIGLSDTLIVKEYDETDADGVSRVVMQANGVIVRMLTEPSAAYLKQKEDERAAEPPPAPTFEQLVAQAVSFADLKALVMEQGN